MQIHPFTVWFPSLNSALATPLQTKKMHQYHKPMQVQHANQQMQAWVPEEAIQFLP